MSTQVRGQPRLASEDVVVSAPMSFTGSAQRIIRLRRRAPDGWQLVTVTALTMTLIALVWALVLMWYLMWGVLLVPYRLHRRGARKRQIEALRHRELMGTIEGSAAASAAAIVSAGIHARTAVAVSPVPTELVGDAERDRTIVS